MQCPKCGYERTSKDDESCPKTDCPKCGVIYSRINIKAVKRSLAQEEK